MSDFTLLPCYSLTPNSLTLFEIPDHYYFSDRQIKAFDNLLNNENRYYELSEHSRKRLKKSIDYLIYISREKTVNGYELKNKSIDTEIVKNVGQKYNKSINFKLSFITLTLSAIQHNSDEEIKSKLLNHFFVELRRKVYFKNYIWKAEKQSNGNIHFHILTNTYINHNLIRSIWNSIQNKQGFNYVDLYSAKMQNFFRNGFKIFENDKRTKETQYQAYLVNKSINWTNPNSTDIHSLYKIKNISSYMTKYLAKNVTKTDRTIKLDTLFYNLDILINKHSLNTTTLLFEPNYDSIQSDIIEKIEIIKKEIQFLKKQGVSGRIWGQSQNLSKIKPFTDVQQYDNIPDITIVEKVNHKKNVLEFGSRKLITYYFDINKTPALQNIFNEHIKSCLNGTNPDFLK